MAVAPATALAAANNTERYQQRRSAILDAAALRFNAQGLRGATLADIGSDVGLVTSSVTYYYRRKEDLALACFQRAIATHRKMAEQAAQAGHDTASRVASFLLAQAGLPQAQAAGQAPPLIEFGDIRALPPAHSTEVFEAYNGLFRAVRALLQDLAGQGLGRAALNARTHLLLSAANWLRVWLRHYEADEHARVARHATDLLLQGLAAQPHAWPTPPALAQMADLALADAPGVFSEDPLAEAFLRAATELVNEQGYRGASVDRIAARLQMTKGAFYHHHDTKLDLISACFDRSQGVVRHTLQVVAQAHGQGWLRACAAALALLRFQLSAHGPLLRASAFSALPDAQARARVRLQAQRLNQRLVGVLVDGMADGSVRPHDPVLGAELLACATNAAAELQRWVPAIAQDTVGELYARPALCGLLSPG